MTKYILFFVIKRELNNSKLISRNITTEENNNWQTTSYLKAKRGKNAGNKSPWKEKRKRHGRKHKLLRSITALETFIPVDQREFFFPASFHPNMRVRFLLKLLIKDLLDIKRQKNSCWRSKMCEKRWRKIVIF